MWDFWDSTYPVNFGIRARPIGVAFFERRKIRKKIKNFIFSHFFMNSEKSLISFYLKKEEKYTKSNMA